MAVDPNALLLKRKVSQVSGNPAPDGSNLLSIVIMSSHVLCGPILVETVSITNPCSYTQYIMLITDMFKTDIYIIFT